MKAKHALYLGLIIIGAAFLLIDATVLGFIFEARGPRSPADLRSHGVGR